MANQTAKTLVAFFDKAMEQLNADNSLAKTVDVDTQSGVTLQNSNNIYWKPVEQQAPIINGWDLTGEETDIIEQNYPLLLDLPKNDFFHMRADDLRDKRFMERRAIASAKKLSADQNKRIADLVASTGTMYYQSATAGFDFVAEADALMTERQIARNMGATFGFDPRAYQAMGTDLASRSDLSGRPETAYGTAGIGKNVAGFDVLRNPAAGQLTARANATTTTVSANVLEVPVGHTNTNGVLQNVDYRIGTVALTDASTFNIGDVITFAGVNSLGVMDKSNTGQLMTFRIVGKTANSINIYPKPIAANQAGITAEQAAYANISTAIVATTVVSKINTVNGRANSFWANDSICIVNGDAQLESLNEFDGMKVVSETLDSGVKLYMAYDANLATLNCRVRLFTWYGLVNKDPSRNGNAVYTG